VIVWVVTLTRITMLRRRCPLAVVTHTSNLSLIALPEGTMRRRRSLISHGYAPISTGTSTMLLYPLWYWLSDVIWDGYEANATILDAHPGVDPGPVN
jgi:hypothetical protein